MTRPRHSQPALTSAAHSNAGRKTACAVHYPPHFEEVSLYEVGDQEPQP